MILARIHSPLFWLGRPIPEEVLLEGEKVPLREVIFRYITNENPSPGEIQGALDLADALEVKTGLLERQLSAEPLATGEAHAILDEVLGLLRAVDDIRKARGVEAPFRSTARLDRVKDERRWLDFVRKIT